MLSLLVITVAQVLAAGDHENEVHSEHSEGELATLESGLDCALVPLQNYNVGLHLAAVFIILAVSALGMFVTIYIGIAKKTPSTEKTMQILKMFGIGIIIGTVWIHLLHDAVDQFSNPCLGSGWSEYGINYVGLFAMFAAFGIQLVEQVSISRSEERAAAKCQQGPDCESGTVLDNGVVLMKPQTHGHSHEIEVFLLGQNINTVVLEIGILVHSLIIGVNLGITDDEGFVSLLIAIAFHQFFEAMALGALISSTRLEWKTKVMLGLAYPLTTPLGVAVGVIVRESFNSNSSSLILSQGILSSLSLGILMYNTYVELIAGEVNRNPIFKAYSPGFKFFCYLVMLVGASAMALIGIWA